jgi:hypothetical protein
MKGKIKIEKRGLLTVFSCSCGSHEVESDEAGVVCFDCGAMHRWELI